MSIQVQHRRDTRATIMTKTPAAGELGYATDTKEMTIGDGSTAGGAFAQKKNFREVLSPSAIGSNQNNYAPTNYDAHCGLLRLTASGNVDITGLTGGTDGRTIAIFNAGASNNITLKDASVSSTAANRFSFGADLILAPKRGAILHYDGTNSLWYSLASFQGSSPLLAANNLSDVASASTARTNLGLGGAAVLAVGTTAGTVAAGDDSRIVGAAQKASNLSDLANAVTARTNLGLGTAAVAATGTSGHTLPFLDGANVFSGSMSLTADAYLNSPLTPSSLGSSQNDYAPASFATSNFLRVQSSAPVNITGLAGGAAGRVVAIINVGANNITLTDSDAGSTAANQFLFGSSVVMAPSQSVLIIYDGSSSRWRAIGVFAGAAGLLLAANNLSDIGNAATARTNLGLGTSATLTSAQVLQAANNLSDLVSATTARTNLSMGAVKLSGGTVAAVASLAMTLTAGYKSYRIILRGMQPVSPGAVYPQLRLSNDGGATYYSAGGSYAFTMSYTTQTGVAFFSSASASYSAGILLAGAQQLTAAAANSVSLIIIDIDPGAVNQYGSVHFKSSVHTTSIVPVNSSGFGYVGNNSAALTNVQFLYSINISAGNYEVYGML